MVAVVVLPDLLVVVLLSAVASYTFTANPWFRKLDFIVKVSYDHSFLMASQEPSNSQLGPIGGSPSLS